MSWSFKKVNSMLTSQSLYNNNTIIIKSEILFFSAWVLFLISILLETISCFSTGAPLIITKGIRYIAYFICCYKLFESRFAKNNIIVLVMILVVFLISCLTSTNKTMLLYLLVLFSVVGINSKKIIKITLWIQGVFLTCVILLSQMGVLEDYIFGKNSIRVRHGLGFTWTTVGPVLFFYFMLCYIFLRKEKFNVMEGIILEAINLILFKLTDSRMAFYLSTVFLLFFLFQGLNKKRWKILSRFQSFWIIFPILCCAISILSAIYFRTDNHFFFTLNKILSNRLSLGHDAIKNYGFTLWGQKIGWIGFNVNRPTVDGLKYNYVDSSYLQLALNYGLLFITIIVSMYTYGIYKAIRQQDYYLVFIYLFVLVFALTEPRLMNFAFNPFPLMVFSGKPIKKWKRILNFREEESRQLDNQLLLKGELNA